jgi:hypothetical protein
MKRTITYITFIFACAVVAILFVTSKSYTQLALAVTLYPAIAYLALQIFPRRGSSNEEIYIPEVKEVPEIETVNTINSVEDAVFEKQTTVNDVDKRAFLKLIGVAGVSVFLFSILSKRGQLPFFGKATDADSVALKDIEGNTITPSQSQPFDGYQIAEIDDGAISYYGFTNKNGAWYIMREDTEESTFRYVKGDNGFPKGWTSREQLNYDYFYNL